MISADPSARGLHRYVALLLLALLLLPSVAHAIETYPIDNLLGRFTGGVQDQWLAAVKEVAGRLFWSLALISLTWTMCMMVFRRADFGELFAELVRFIVMTGLFWWLLEEGSDLIQNVLESMRLLGEDGSGDGKLKPSSLLRSGYQVFFEVAKYSESGTWKEADKIVGLTMAAVILALIALSAVSMMLITLMTWILGYAGLFLLGFGGARWTSGLAINYYKHVLAVGMSYFVMLLLAGIGDQFISEYSRGVAAQITLPNLAIMLVAAIVLLALLVRIPAMVSSMVLGSRFGGAAGTSFSGHVMAFGGSAIAAGVSHASSGAQALYSAYNAPSAAPPPAPMITMPTFHVPAAPAAPAAPPAAPSPMPTAMISVSHLDSQGMSPLAVTLNTQGMYPPPAGAAQNSVFGASPSAHEVARAQVQPAPAAGGAGAAGAAGTMAAAATPAAALGREAESGKLAAAPTLATAATRADVDAVKVPAIDVERLQRSQSTESPVPATTLSAATASLPASPQAAASAADLEAEDRRADAATGKHRPANQPEPGFSSFASQPLSGSALPSNENADDRGRDKHSGRRDPSASAVGSGSDASPVADGRRQSPAGSSASSPAAARSTGGTTPAAAASSSAAQAAPANTGSSRRASSSAGDAHGGKLSVSTAGDSSTSRSEQRRSTSTPDGAPASPASAVSQVIPAADRTAADPLQSASAVVSPDKAQSAAVPAQRRRNRFVSLLRALWLRLRRQGGDGHGG